MNLYYNEIKIFFLFFVFSFEKIVSLRLNLYYNEIKIKYFFCFLFFF